MSSRIIVGLMVVACVAGAIQAMQLASVGGAHEADLSGQTVGSPGPTNKTCWPCVTFIDIWKADDSAKFKNDIEALCDVFVGPQPFDECLNYLEKDAGKVQTSNSSLEICHYFGLCFDPKLN